jgi:hypothetical protein
MKRNVLVMLASLFVSTVFAQPMQPSESWVYQLPLKQDLREVYAKGLCKIDDRYHLFMTAGITYTTKDRKSWDMYYAIPYKELEGKKLHGGPNPNCGEQPYFTSPSWGLYFWQNNQWVKKDNKLSDEEGDLSLTTGDRQRMYYGRHDKTQYIVSSEDGWWRPEVLKNLEDYYYLYYQSEFGFVGQPRKNFLEKPAVHIKGEVVSEITGVKFGIVEGVMLDNKFYMIRREGEDGTPLQFTAYRINKDFHGGEVDFSPLYLTEAGPYECYNAQENLAICRYNKGLVFVAETPTGIGAVTLPLHEGEGRERESFYQCTPGVDTLYCDTSSGKRLYDGLPYWVGTVSEFRYDDIVKRIQDDYHAHRKQSKN